MTTSALAHNGGKRKGAVCAYLETWHIDIEEFLDLRKNTGDDRRRTHDMNTANWIPDLFMKRVAEDADWTLFSPNDVPELHDLYGTQFELQYIKCEEKAARGEIKLHKQIKAQDLWRKMLGMLFETGHPWLTFKDPCNLRSPQQHIGELGKPVDDIAVAPAATVGERRRQLPVVERQKGFQVACADRVNQAIIEIQTCCVCLSRTLRHHP
jgi:ribonucleotide reductase alpha subunit